MFDVFILDAQQNSEAEGKSKGRVRLQIPLTSVVFLARDCQGKGIILKLREVPDSGGVNL